MNNVSIDISKSGNVLVKTIIDEDTRVTKAEIQHLDFFDVPIFTVRGKARWNPIDNYDPKIGKGIALGRAWAKYGKKLAAYFISQSVSVGETRRQLRQARDIQMTGEIVKASEEFGKEQIRRQQIDAARAERREYWQQMRATEGNQNAPQAPTTTLEAPQIEEVGEDTTSEQSPQTKN